jgi:hypothetical protein
LFGSWTLTRSTFRSKLFHSKKPILASTESRLPAPLRGLSFRLWTRAAGRRSFYLFT